MASYNVEIIELVVLKADIGSQEGLEEKLENCNPH